MSTKAVSAREIVNHELAADLAQYDELYQSAEGSAASSPRTETEIPDGEYSVVVEQVDFTRTQTTGNNMMVWKFRVREGAYAGQILRKNRVITERTIPWLKEELQKSGLKIERLSELPLNIGKLPGRELRVLKRTKDGNANIYIQWSSPRPMEADDDLPF